MPTLGAHFNDDTAKLIETVAKASDQKKTSPWIAEACHQRLERDGMLPGNPNAEVLAAAHEVGVEKAVDLLKRHARQMRTQKKAA